VACSSSATCSESCSGRRPTPSRRWLPSCIRISRRASGSPCIGPRNCKSCHAVINPIGFTLEHFDAIGRFRAEEKGRPIDASGTYTPRSGNEVEFAGVRDLARYLASSEEVHEAFVARLFHYLVKQPIRAFGSEEQADLRRVFADNGYSIRRLAVEIAARAALPDPAKVARDKTARIP